MHELETQFINYFKNHTHTHVESSSVVPYNDNTLLFTNSGMVQFKKLFSSAQSLLPYTRATSAQHCIRAGGKHNDLDDVGKDSYHHTYFVMLGNWSFGDYFKKESVKYAWDFLVNVIKLDPSRMYVTYYSGNKKCFKNNKNDEINQNANINAKEKKSIEADLLLENGVEHEKIDKKESNIQLEDLNNKTKKCDPLDFSDEETRKLWLNYLPPECILPFDQKDNFWEMGDTGPCGPCTEIHYDCRADQSTSAADLVNKDDPEVIEIWNIVFIEFYRNADRSLSQLPMKCIDTGMGLERVLRILDNVKSNYLTQPFVRIIRKIEAAIGENCKSNANEKGNANEMDNKSGSINKIKNKNENNNENKNQTENKNLKCKGNEIPCNNNFYAKSKIEKNKETNKIVKELPGNMTDFNDVSNFNFSYYKDTYHPNPNFHVDMSIRVIADHSRTIAICLFYGVTFSSEGRGYVLRRIMRRAVRFCQELNLENVMSSFVKEAGDCIGIELQENHLSLIKEEERLFLRTLGKGKKMLYKIIDDLLTKNKLNGVTNLTSENSIKINNDNSIASNNNLILSGKDAFLLYDTFGFPIDLTQMMCEEKGIKINLDEFEKCKEEGRKKSRKKVENEDVFDFRGLEKIKDLVKTDDICKYNENRIRCNLLCILSGNEILYKKDSSNNFGYDNSCKNNCTSENYNDNAKSNIINNDKTNNKEGILKCNFKSLHEIISNVNNNNKLFSFISDKTCFYAESGGQVGDKGRIEITENEKFICNVDIIDTKEYNGYILHKGYINSNEDIKNYDCRSNTYNNIDAEQVDNRNYMLILIYNEELRNNTRKNHTATHLLNHTLRKFLQSGTQSKELNNKDTTNNNTNSNLDNKVNTNMINDSNKKISKNNSNTQYNHTRNTTDTYIEQKGSYVDDNKLRFDFSYGKSLTKEEIKIIEDYMNNLIKKGAVVTSEIIKFNSISNDIIYLKEEKYPENVRVVKIDGVSSELCGGTHVTNLKEIQKIRIMTEGSISSNTRRIVAVTGEEAIRVDKIYNEIINQCSNINNKDDKKNNNINNINYNNDINTFNDINTLNNLTGELPFYDKLVLMEKIKEEEKNINAKKKEIIKNNIERLLEEYKKYEEEEINTKINHLNISNKEATSNKVNNDNKVSNSEICNSEICNDKISNDNNINRINVINRTNEINRINEINSVNSIIINKSWEEIKKVTGILLEEFVFSCDFKEIKLKNIGKELNNISLILEKNKIIGMVYYIINNEIYFSFRGDRSMERCKEFCKGLKNINIGGNDKCASGKGTF